jgi:hypothetical protein
MKTYLLLVLFATFFVAHVIKLGTSQNITRFRSTMINPHLKEEDFRVLANWKANHIRWQLKWGTNGHEADTADIPHYQAWLESALTEFDSIAPVLREIGLNVLLDLHTSRGGRDQQNRWRLFNDTQF